MPPSSRPPEDLDLAAVCQGVCLSLLFAFLSILVKLAYPIALLQPFWQIKTAEALLGTASLPLVAGVLLIFAQRYDPESPILATRVLWARRVAILAALGFFLLIPLQISAAMRQINQATSNEVRQLRNFQNVANAIAQAKTPPELYRAVSKIPGLPPDFRIDDSLPIPLVRSTLLGEIRPQILNLEARLRQLRRDRLQGSLTFLVFNGLTCLAYGIGFAAIGRLGEEKATLLQFLVGLPVRLRLGFHHFRLALLSGTLIPPQLRLFQDRWLRWPRLPRLPRWPRPSEPPRPRPRRRRDDPGGFRFPFFRRRRHSRRYRAQRVWLSFLRRYPPSSGRDPRTEAWLRDESDRDSNRPS
jgi:hypothetical protein